MDVGAWLRHLGLGQYEAVFRDNAIDSDVLPSLTADDLKELGVMALGHRRKLLDAVAALAAPKSSGIPAAESGAPTDRRQLAVMFCDLVSSTALSARLDPEDMRVVITAYHKAVAGAVQSADGFVAKYMGDGVLVYFGCPRAHEDDAERAVRAGLAVVEAVSKINAPDGKPLYARVGVATGIVVVGDLIGSGESSERGVVGDTPNLAARLQAIAEPNQVVICETTRKLIGNLFELRDLGGRELKGIAAPARAFAVMRARTVEGRFEALHSEGLIDLIGREEELAFLLRRWAKASAGDGQVVLLMGEAGIGKSRLMAALLEHLSTERHVRLRYFCSPQHVDSAFHPIIGQLERAAAFSREDDAKAKLDKLDALLALSAASPAEAALCADLLSLGNDGRYPKLEMSSQQQRQMTLDALVNQAEALSRNAPALLILEDAHWADPSSLEVFGKVIDRIDRLKALLIVTYRPEFAPPWIGGPYVSALTLNRLPRREIGEMVARIVGDKRLSEEVCRDIIERADGVPLFAEEIAKAAVEATGEGGAERVLAGVPSPVDAVPASLHASLMSRLDRLGAAKEIAPIAACIGREFDHALLAAVAGVADAELRRLLHELRAAQLIFVRGFPPDERYTFKHTLVRDAARSSLLRARRASFHAAIADACERSFPELVEVQPEIVAHHLAEAGISERAIPYWLRAAQIAASRSANSEAIAQIRRGLSAVDALPDDPRKDRLELDLQSVLGPCLISTAGPTSDAAVANFTRALELCEKLKGQPEQLHVLHWLTTVRFVRGELRDAFETAEMAISLAKARNDRPALVNSLRGSALILLMMGRLTQSLDRAAQASAIFQAASADEQLSARAAGQDAGVATLAVESWALWALGHRDQAVNRIASALARAASIGHPHTLQTVRKLPEFGVKQREERAVRESERWASSAA
jgi:predicted ATPase/class 3 adenylate cyclase